MGPSNTVQHANNSQSSSVSSSRPEAPTFVPTPTASGVPALALASPTVIAGDPVNGSPTDYDDVVWPVSLKARQHEGSYRLTHASLGLSFYELDLVWPVKSQYLRELKRSKSIVNNSFRHAQSGLADSAKALGIQYLDEEYTNQRIPYFGYSGCTPGVYSSTSYNTNATCFSGMYTVDKPECERCADPNWHPQTRRR